MLYLTTFIIRKKKKSQRYHLKVPPRNHLILLIFLIGKECSWPEVTHLQSGRTRLESKSPATPRARLERQGWGQECHPQAHPALPPTGLGPWACYLISLGFYFLVCKLGLPAVPVAEVVVRIKFRSS